MPYQVRTHAFEGPFDLLLHLIAKRELDIYEVALAEITEEYLAHLRQMEELDLEIATEFLVVAATLIEIKAARLLPGPPVDEEEALAISERDLLIARLLEYRGIKEAAERLQRTMADNAGFVPRSAGPGPELANLAPDLMARVSPADLRDLAAAILAAKPEDLHVDVSHIAPIRASVSEAVAEVGAALRDKPQWSFRQLTVRCRSRIEIIVRFLAVLELVKRGEADVAQAGTFGEIVVIRREDAPPVRLDVDEYRGAVELEPDRSIALEPERPSEVER